MRVRACVCGRACVGVRVRAWAGVRVRACVCVRERACESRRERACAGANICISFPTFESRVNIFGLCEEDSAGVLGMAAELVFAPAEGGPASVWLYGTGQARAGRERARRVRPAT